MEQPPAGQADDSNGSPDVAGAATAHPPSAARPVPRTRMADDQPFILALLLTALAGWVDAAGFSDAHTLFLSFMSGNTAHLAVSLTRHEWTTAYTTGSIIGLFVAAVTFGEIVATWAGRRHHTVILALEALFLGLGAAVHGPDVDLAADPSLFPVVFAMGLQNASLHRAGGLNIGLTYVTGTLVQIGRALADLVGGRGDPRRLGQYLALWLSLAVGAGLGALALSISLFVVLTAAAATAVALAVVTYFSGSARQVDADRRSP